LGLLASIISENQKFVWGAVGAGWCGGWVG
jgi:hypothetical protein